MKIIYFDICSIPLFLILLFYLLFPEDDPRECQPAVYNTSGDITDQCIRGS